MATSARKERQLMRQRGAGLRDIENTDFGLQVESQGSRNERQLMRQRGAGNRKVSDVDFGFSFPTPGSSRRRVIRTPDDGTRHNDRMLRDSTSTRSKSSVKNSVNNQDRGLDELLSKGQVVTGVSGSEGHSEQPSTKRRRIHKTLEDRTPLYPRQRRAPSNASFSIAEEPELDQAREELAGHLGQHTNSPLHSVADEDKENDASEGNKKKSIPKRKKRKSIVQQIGRKRRKKSSSVSLQEPSVLTSEAEPLNTPVVMQTNPGMVGSNKLVSKESVHEEPSRDSSETPDTIRARSEHNHISSTLGRNKRKSALANTAAAVNHERPDSQQQRNIADDTDLSENSEEDQAREANSTRRRLEAKKVLDRPQRRKRSKDELSIAASSPVPHHDDVEEDETYIEEEQTPEPPTPAATRRPRTKRSRRRDDIRKDTTERKPRGSSFPILTHRMMNHSALPTITEEEGDNDNLDQHRQISYGEFSDRKVPNAVDVLSQICRETVESALEKLDTQNNAGSGRADTKRKRDALEAFGNDLDQRLFDMSELVEHRMTLEARLRKSQREKADLQARWLNLRRERDELALRADAVRRQNWESEEENAELWQISELAHRTELELEQGPPEAVGLEFMLRDIAGSLSTTTCGGGLIGKVRAFNAQLESIAASLEGH